MPLHGGRWIFAGVLVALVLAGGIALDSSIGWFAPVFRAVAHLFYEQSAVAMLRAPSQLVLARVHVLILMTLVACALIASPWMSWHARALSAVICVGYAIRAAIWIAGGNLPLVPGDSSHYVEVATSIYRGQGPVKHYVESFFVDYSKHGFNNTGFVLDDWATPLWSYLLAVCYRVTGVVPGNSLEATFAVAKGASFLLNLMALPALYGFVQRCVDRRLALGSMAVLAILPVHAIYAGFALRESLVALTSVLAVWALFEVFRASGRWVWMWAGIAGFFSGLAILARNTALVLVAAAGLYGVVYFRKRIGPLLVWGMVALGTVAPWAWATYQEYGEPFFTYTKYYPYNFAWTVHHFDRGNTEPVQFYTAANAASIARVKVKSLLIVALYSTMILSAPLVLGFLYELGSKREEPQDRRNSRRVYARFTAVLFLAFLAATLIQINDVTQVQQLGRYYLPVFVLMIPVAVGGVIGWLRMHTHPGTAKAIALVTVAALWCNPAWAYDATWLMSPFQTRLPALRAAGEWMRAHPDRVPTDARVVTWFPWEMRVLSDRSTILFPRALEAGEYELKRLRETIQRYRATHVLWGSFEHGDEGDPETFGPYLESLREVLGLTDARLLWKSTGLPHPVRLYRLPGASP